MFAIIGTSGSLLGEFIGGREFRLRLIRLAALVLALAGSNFETDAGVLLRVVAHVPLTA